MWATLWCQRWIVSVNLNWQLWPKLSEVWTQETAAFYTDGPIFYPENDATPSPLSSSKLHRQQQYTSQTEFDIRGLLETAPHQWSCCWSEHKHPAGRELHNDSLLLLVTRYQIRFQFDGGSTKTVILFFCAHSTSLRTATSVCQFRNLVRTEISQELIDGLTWKVEWPSSKGEFNQLWLFLGNSSEAP